MPVTFNPSNVWAAGWPSPLKGGWIMRSQCDANQDGDECDFRWHGTIRLFVQPYGSRNVWACSDFSTFSIGNTPFTEVDANGTFHGWAYEHPLPWPGDRTKYGNDPIRGTGDFLMQFRCDTARYYNPNAISLWVRNAGLVVDKSRRIVGAWGGRTVTTDNYWDYVNWTSPYAEEYNFDFTFHMHLTRDPEQIVIYENSSGATSSYDHSWFLRRRVVWVRNFIDAGDIMFDYRPGDRKLNGVWESHNRKNGGVASRKVSGNWPDNLRTEDGDKDATGNPPTKKRSGTWYNMHLIGAHQKD